MLTVLTTPRHADRYGSLRRVLDLRCWYHQRYQLTHKTMGKLPDYKGYTVDMRLKQFRRVHEGDCVCGGGEIEFIDFDSEKGSNLLDEMIVAELVRVGESLVAQGIHLGEK